MSMSPNRRGYLCDRVTLPTFKSLLSPLLALVGYGLSLSLSSLICKMRIITITISLRALMVMYINHLAQFLSHSKCSINVTLAFYSFINHIGVSHQTVNTSGVRILSYSHFTLASSRLSNLTVVLKTVSLLASVISSSPVLPQTSLAAPFQFPQLHLPSLSDR